MQTISPFLWFDGNAGEAVDFYVSTFPNSRILKVFRAADADAGPDGMVMSATFELNGREFMAFNGGPMFTFSPAISLFVNCETQDEVDTLWETLSEGGEKQRCGWLKDKYGVSWQIVPTALGQLLYDPGRDKSNRVMQAMLGMTKLDIEGLRRAYQG